jgi:tetratricopeptide (TPR) repeat protein
MQRETTKGVLALAALALTAGCGTQRIGETHARGPEDDVPGAAGKVTPSDPLAAKPGMAAKVEKRDITEDQQEDFDKAVARWDKARKAGTLKGGDCDDVARAFGRVADEHQDLREARHNQAAVLLDCGKVADATRIWESLASGPKPYAPALSSLGYLAWKNGDAARAESLFDRAVQADKQVGSVAARLNLAQIYRDRARRSSSSDEKLRLHKEALDHLRRVLAVDGNNLQAYATLCYFYYDLDLLEMARLVGDQAIGRAEEIATGKFIEQKGEQTAAEQNKPAAKKGKGKKGDAEESAPKRLKEVTAQGTGYTVEMKKNLGMVYNTLGLVWLKRKSVSQAISNFKKAVEMDPELQEARMNLGALSLNYRDYKTAEENFKAVLAAWPTNYEATIGLGVALRGNRKVDEAEQQYLAAQKIDPQNPDSYFDLGILYQEYKGFERSTLMKAQQYYRDFLGRAGSASKRREAEKRIKDIDDTMKALEEAAKLQKEAEEIQRKSDEQQKKMEEELRKMQDQEKQQGGGTQPPGQPGTGGSNPPQSAAPAEPAGAAGPAAAKGAK